MWALCFQSPPYQGVTVSPPKLYYKMQVLDTSAWSTQAQLLHSSNSCMSGCRNHISFSISLVRNAWLCASYRFGFILFIDRFLLAEATGEGPFSSKTSRHLCVFCLQGLRLWVEAADAGVVVVSFGIGIRALPNDLVEKMAGAFARLPQRVVWR